MSQRKKSFTFIELLIALAVIAICFLPLMRMFSGVLEHIGEAGDLTTATVLAKEEMEKTKNLNFTKAQLKSIGEVWYPPLDQPALVMNGKQWRILRKVIKNTDPLEVRIQVYQFRNLRAVNKDIPLVELVTIIEDLEWSSAE